MTHQLIAVIVKAQNEIEARRKAEDARELICGSESHMGTTYDWGIVINGDLNEFTGRWIPREKTHPLYERLNRSRRISRLDSENGQEFINSCYDSIGSEIKDDLIIRPFNRNYPDMGPEDEWYKKGFFVRDEQGQYILQNDSRLHDKNYFVVPLDMHSTSIAIVDTDTII